MKNSPRAVGEPTSRKAPPALDVYVIPTPEDGLYNEISSHPSRGTLGVMDKIEVLRAIAFGHRVAEDETDVLSTYFVETDHWQRLYRGDIDIVYGPKGSGKSALYSLLLSKRTNIFRSDVLSTYFVETDHWQRLYRGDIDIVYGPKGSGKSALYSLLLSKRTELFDRNILLVAGENPRGATAFRDLMTDPPASEREFVGLWKLYIASIIHSALAEYGIKNDSTRELEEA